MLVTWVLIPTDRSPIGTIAGEMIVLYVLSTQFTLTHTFTPVHTIKHAHKHKIVRVLIHTNSHVRTQRQIDLKQDLTNFCNLVFLLIVVHVCPVGKIAESK